MVTFRRILFGSALGLGCAFGAPQAFASQLTDAFVANVKPNVDFLDKASRLAVDRSPSRRVRAYAQDVAARETIVENSLVAWWQANTPAGASAALGTRAPQADQSPLEGLEPIGKVAGDVTQSLVDGSLLTGRSVAIDKPAPEAPPAARPLLPSQEQDYKTLQTLNGRRFDAFYKLAQRNALRQLVALYRDYASKGDDPALRSISTLQLEKTNELIGKLNALR